MSSENTKVNKDMTFAELLQIRPNAAMVLSGYGLHCIGCHLSVSETIEQGMKAHGLGDDKIQELVDELNAE